jgi:hypothetical protein
MTRNIPPPVKLGLPEIGDMLEGMLGPPHPAADQLGALRLLTVVRPDDHARWLHELERLLPTIHRPATRLKALSLAVDLLAPSERPRSFGEAVLHALMTVDEDA